MTTVVITGVGATTPLGGTATATWENAVAGNSGIHTLPFDWVETLPVHFAGRVVVEPTDQGLEPVKARRLDRSQQIPHRRMFMRIVELVVRQIGRASCRERV